MGQTLNVAARWTSAGEGPRGSLEYNQANELILNKFIQYCEAFCGQFPEESKVVFKQALTWKSELKPADFTGLTQKGDEHVSDATSGDGQPLLSLRKDDRSYSISVRSFEMIDQVMKTAGEKKIAETRLCLEANPDPIPKMLGDRFATTKDEDMAMYRFAGEAIAGGQQQQQRSGGEDGQEQQQMEKSSADNPSKETLLKMLISLKGLDDRTLQDVVIHCTSHVRLSPAAIDDTMKFWSSYCGNDERRYLLQSLHYHQDYTTVYSSGCRAPPWRCIPGDICYIIAIPHNEDSIYITASTQGYFVNGGENREDHTLNFEKEGEFYPELITLLQAKSSSFAEKATQQNFFKLHEQKRDGGMYESMAIEPYEDKSGAQETQRSQKKDEENKKKKEKKNKEQEKKKKLEPSLRWKNLQEVDDYDDTAEKRKKKQPRKKRDSQKIVTSDGEDSFEESSSESEEEEETPDRRNEANSDLPSEYWQIQKLVKYLKGGNQTATVIALCALRDFNLQQETCQLAIRDVGGLEVLINLLDTDAIKCKIGSLMILKEISRNTQIRRAIADLGGLQTMVKIMRDPNKDLKCLAAETIANVAKFRRARRTVRQHGGIRKLVGLLDCAPLGSISSAEQEKDVEVARSGALALWSCSKSTRNKMAMRKAGAIPLLAKLLKSQHENMLIPVVGTLQECATEPSYRLAIRTEGMIEDLVKNLNSENQELQMHCASAIFKCAEEKETRDLVRQYGGLDPLVALLNNTDNKELLAAATGAIWKCAISPENVTRFQELKAIDLLVALLNKQPEEVLVNVVGALAELAQDPPNRLAIRKAGGIQPLVQLLTGTNQALLVNVTKAVGQCAEEPDNMVVIDKLDGVRLVWSLLKNPNPEVQASAAWAICPCIENAKDSGEMVRSFVGGLELIVSLLKSDDQEVLASVCAAVANIANDEENLAVITDHGVVPMLADLTETDDDRLRRHLAEAIARCCNWGNNRIEFGNKDAVAPLVDYLESPDTQVHRSTARALYQLSKDPENCITMHDAGVVKPLMKMVGAEDEILQEAAAGCISNIRRLALANERARNKNH